MDVSKRGRKSIENNPNVNCRLCKESLLIKFGNCVKSCVNLFKPSAREGSKGVIHSDILAAFGIDVRDLPGFSRVVCNNCARKIRLLQSTHDALKKGSESKPQREIKRKFSTPTRVSPCAKVRRIRSPASKKSLTFGKENSNNLLVSNSLNVDDLQPETEKSDLKVVIAYPNGNVVVKSNIDDDSKTVIRNIALKQWRSAANSVFKHDLILPELQLKIEKDVTKELSEFCKHEDCILKRIEPDQLAVFSNKLLVHEIETLI